MFKKGSRPRSLPTALAKEINSYLALGPTWARLFFMIQFSTFAAFPTSKLAV